LGPCRKRVSPLVWSFPSIEGPKKELKPVPGEPPNLLNPTSGKIYIGGEDIAGLKKENLKKFRKNIQMIFQDPFESLNPRLTIHNTIAEPLGVWE
jgi:ABC-type dipeptide/oligopeptide/nickel transport system ATPase component